MWGFGGRWYWRRRGGGREGIVVVFSWISSEERHLGSYSNLYSSIGWDSLVCHSQFLNMFFPEKAAVVASDIVSELVKELKPKPIPVVFASFSGGTKACMYKVLQILDGTCETGLDPDDCRMVRDCISAFIYDSSPVDFTSDLGARFVVHPSVLKMSHPPKPAVWAASSIASGLDFLFLNRFESHRAEYWQTLYSSITMGAPYLIFCSENDDLAPYRVIHNFAKRLKELGGYVKVFKWNDSPHVGHYRQHKVDYKAAVSELLSKAVSIYLQKKRSLARETTRGIEETHIDETSEPIQSVRKATFDIHHQSFKGTPPVTSDHFFVPSSVGYHVGGDGWSVHDEYKEGLIRLPNRETDVISPHGVLGQMLFDVCVPKNVDDWDVKMLGSSHLKRRCNPMRCIRRSRL